MIEFSGIWSLASNALFMCIGVLGIGFVIAFHEFGHFLFGKLFGVTIHTFSIGFGPQLITKRIWDTNFTISLIPLGGYVEPEPGLKENPTPGTIAFLPYWKKMMIIFGGILFNIIFAYGAFVFLGMTGIPESQMYTETGAHKVHMVLADSAAFKAGITKGDKIISINGQDVSHNLALLKELINKPSEHPLNLALERNNEQISLTVTPDEIVQKNTSVRQLGTGFIFEKTPGVSFNAAVKKAYTRTTSIMRNTLGFFKQAAKKRSTEGLSGPIGMITMAITMIQQSFLLFLLLLAVISVNLAALNLLPLPILDGGQGLTYTIEALWGKPLKESVINTIHIGSWVFMMALFAYLTYKDVITLWFS